MNNCILQEWCYLYNDAGDGYQSCEKHTDCAGVKRNPCKGACSY